MKILRATNLQENWSPLNCVRTWKWVALFYSSRLHFLDCFYLRFKSESESMSTIQIDEIDKHSFSHDWSHDRIPDRTFQVCDSSLSLPFPFSSLRRNWVNHFWAIRIYIHFLKSGRQKSTANIGKRYRARNSSLFLERPKMMNDCFSRLVFFKIFEPRSKNWNGQHAILRKEC